MEPNIQDSSTPRHPEMSEDCLYLKVATPATASGEKIRYTSVHGGWDCSTGIQIYIL
jgi:carboxylesterase type B